MSSIRTCMCRDIMTLIQMFLVYALFDTTRSVKISCKMFVFSILTCISMKISRMHEVMHNVLTVLCCCLFRVSQHKNITMKSLSFLLKKTNKNAKTVCWCIKSKESAFFSFLFDLCYFQNVKVLRVSQGFCKLHVVPSILFRNGQFVVSKCL